MNDITVLEPLQSVIQSFSVHTEHLSEIFLSSADKTGLFMLIQRQPEKYSQNRRRGRVFQQLIAFVHVKFQSDRLQVKKAKSGIIARLRF